MDRPIVKAGDTIRWGIWEKGVVQETNGHCMLVEQEDGDLIGLCSAETEVRVLTTLDLLADV
jgi:hypothetical protein